MAIETIAMIDQPSSRSQLSGANAFGIVLFRRKWQAWR
jgi:hypothetical protein